MVLTVNGRVGLVEEGRTFGSPHTRMKGVVDETRLVERVGMDGDLDVEFVRDAEADIDGCGRGSPILVQLEPDRAGQDLLAQGPGGAAVPLAEEAQIHRVGLGCLEHAVDVPSAGGACGRVRAVCGTGSSAEHGRDA